jgi:replicative DNA helicase Mcm
MDAVIKLAEANAKLRLSEKVEVEDFNVAKQIFLFCIGQLGVDEATGKLDMSRMTEKIPLSKRGKMDSFFEMMNLLCDNEQEETRYGIILEEAEKIGIKSWDVNMFLEGLQRETKIYEPRKGFYKMVRK